MKKFSFPIFWKFSLAILVIVFVFGSINAYLTWTNVLSSLQKESEKRGLYIARNLAEESINPLLYDDLVDLQKLLDGAMKLDSSIYYIFIVDENNQPVVHTFEEGVPLGLLLLSNRIRSVKPSVNLLKVQRKPNYLIRNITVPIFEGKLGYIHVGILEKDILQNVSRTVAIFWFMVGLFVIVGIAGAFAFAYFITAPIKKIQEVADELDFDALETRSIQEIHIREKLFNKWPVLFRAMDEIDTLTDRFNGMIKRLEKAYSDLQKANEKLLQSEKMASIGIITAGIAHEINNPISGIKNCIRRIKIKPDDVEQTGKYLILMEEAILRIEEVVRELLDFSRKREFKLQPVAIKPLLEKSLLLLSYKLEKLHISITNDIPENAPPVMGSENHLEQVFINLILNSIDAIEEKMNLEKTSGDFRGHIQFGFSIKNEYEIISVRDNGIGIEKEKLAYIFDPFFTTKSIGKGTGLGLAVSFNVIQAHEGKIEVESEYGKGTKFRIYLKQVGIKEKV